MYWFWLNMPLAAAFFAAWVGIPMWLVFKHPDGAPRPDTSTTAVSTQTITTSSPAARGAEPAISTSCPVRVYG
jgi:uncharacterized membrane protein YbhN (UPF0104 family)